MSRNFRQLFPGFDNYFPGVRVSFHERSAQNFLAECNKHFNCICIDIFDDIAHPPCLFTDRFWEVTKSALAKPGVVLLNAWGLPWHLRPLSKVTVQAVLASIVQAHWPYVFAFPYRRNITFVASDQPGCHPPDCRRSDKPPRVKSELRPLDQAVLLALKGIRLRKAAPLSTMEQEPRLLNLEGTTREGINTAMASEWPQFLSCAAEVGEKIGLALEGRNFLHRLWQEPRLAIDVLEELLGSDSPVKDFIPIAAAGSAFDHLETRGSWFGDWVISHFDWIAENDPKWLYEMALPQAFSLANNPLIPDMPWASRLCNLTLSVAQEL
jgi:Spermine/spermidine synthase domain